MWWLEMRKGILGISRLSRLAAPFAAACLLAGCFQPLYGEHSAGAGPSIREQMRTVDVAQIAAANGTPESRLAVNVREALLFGISADNKPIKPRYRLEIRMTSSRLTVVVDLTSGRPEVENYGINATYQLIDLATNKVVVNDQTFSRASYDIPGEEQRFAQARGLRDAENRAAEEIANSIKTRLASYFVAGT
ncbi:MAG TPA: LPS assembly lipoprotein LptE [Xanthobacteraceae bacterium]|jgi:LPS-assembly lipoprotein